MTAEASEQGEARTEKTKTGDEKASGHDGPKRTNWLKWLASVLVVVIALLVFPVWWQLSKANQPAATSCKLPGKPLQAKGSPPPLPKGVKPAKLILVSGQTTTLEFYRALTAKTLTIQYAINGNIRDVGANRYPDLQVADPLGFSRSDQTPIPGTQVKVAAWYQNGRVLLKVCVNRSHSTLAPPGLYQGTVSIVDPRVDPVNVPVSITLSYPSWQWIMELLALAALLGAWYIWVLQDKKVKGKTPFEQFRDFCGSMVGLLSIGAGVVAAFSVYNATYLNSATWGSTSGQVFALFGAMFSAFLAGAATVHVGAKAGKYRTIQKTKGKGPPPADPNARPQNMNR